MSLADILDTYYIHLTGLKGGCNIIIIISFADYRFSNIIIADYRLSGYNEKLGSYEIQHMANSSTKT